MSSDSRIAIHLKNYRDIIRQMVGEQPIHSNAPRPFPQFPTVYYDGINDSLAFDNWLRTLLLYFRASVMCGEENDDFRVTTAARCLKGIARDWFFARVVVPGSSIPYRFEEVIIGLAQVFLTFDCLGWPRYIPGTTARAFHFQLQHWHEMNNTTTEEQRDLAVQQLFILGMREVTLELYLEQGESIRNWWGGCDTSSTERMLTHAQRTLDGLKAVKQAEVQEKRRRK